MALPGAKRPLRPSSVLALDLSAPVTDEGRPSVLAGALTHRGPDLRDVVECIDEAADDPRVRVLLALVDRPSATWAAAEELRAAVAVFRAAGKRTIAHAQSFGEAADGTLAYYVATAFDEIHLQPSGDLGLAGLAAEVPFVAGLLEQLDLTPQVDRRHEYKTAANLLTERRFTAAHRESVDRIVASHHEQLVAAIAAGRRLDEAEAVAAVDAGPRDGADALAAGLVDRLAYRDQSVAAAKALAGPGARLWSLKAYRSVRRRRALRPRRRTKVALVHGVGAIGVGPSRRSPLGPTMGSDTIARGFTQALRDDRIKAILFRVDSPGGSAVASDAIWRAVARAREAGKPVIVSMGSVAGSGGYWVAMGADRIVASPGTLTGSIGVVMGKVVTRALKARWGITSDQAHRGPYALMFSPNHAFTDAQWDRVQGYLDRVYAQFVDKVASSRGLAREQVHESARGRVWTGADAADRGLVDELGGYLDAYAALRRALGLSEDAPLSVRTLPRRSVLERLGARRADVPEGRAGAAAVGALLRSAGFGQRGSAVMPEWARQLR